MSKDLRMLLRELKRQGFQVKPTKRGHVRVLRDGQTVGFLAGTPSDWRSHRNAVATLRRAGFVHHSHV